MSSSEAFRRALEIVKAETIETKVAGVSFAKRRKALERLTQYDAEQISINLSREAELEFPLSTAVQIEIRVSTISEKGCSLLLYKDARYDMNIIDDVVGSYNWKREHTRDNANCIVSIWDNEKNQWIPKEDTVTQSCTEKEKGLASDSFKRACYCRGIGRELYTAPFIWITSDKVNIFDKNGKKATYDTFTVSKIDYSDKIITRENMKTSPYNKNLGREDYLCTLKQKLIIRN